MLGLEKAGYWEPNIIGWAVEHSNKAHIDVQIQSIGGGQDSPRSEQQFPHRSLSLPPEVLGQENPHYVPEAPPN
jgi:hypothetical protein